MAIKRGIIGSIKAALKNLQATSLTTSGKVFTVRRLLGSTSAFSLVTGSHANLQINAAGEVSTTGIGVGESQIGIVREALGNTALERSFKISAGFSSAVAITSPSSYSTPARTQRYQQETATDVGTWSIGSGGDGNLFAIDSATGIRRFTDAAVTSLADITSNRVLSLPLVFTKTSDGTTATKTVSVTVEPIEKTVALSEAYELPMNTAAGTVLTGVSGWELSFPGAASSPTLPQFDGTKLMGVSGNRDYAALKTSEVSRAGATIEVVVGRQAAENYVSFALAFAAQDYNNAIVVPILCYPGSNGTIQTSDFYKFQNGIRTPITQDTNNVGPRADGTTLVRATYSADGNTLTIDFIGGNRTYTRVIDLAGGTYGNRYGLHGGGGQPTMDAAINIRRFSYINSKTTLAITSHDEWVSGNVANLAITWNGTKPTRLQHRIEDTTGTGLTPWITGESVVTGTGSSGTATYKVTTPGKISGFIRVRAYNDTGSLVRASDDTIFFAPSTQFSLGYNVIGYGYGFASGVMHNNWGKCCEIRTASSEKKIYIPSAAINGKCTIETVTGVTFNGVSDSTLKILDTQPSTGVHRLEITGDVGFNAVRYLSYTGTDPTYIKVTRDGRTGVVASEWVDGMEGTWFRDMDVMGINSVPRGAGTTMFRDEPTSLYYMNRTSVNVCWPYQDATSAMIAWKTAKPTEAKGWWHTLGVDESDSFIRTKFTYIRDNLLIPFPDFKFAFTFGNETPWNTDFDAVLRASYDGIRNGHWGDATWDNPKAPVTIIENVPINGDKDTNTDGMAVPAGTLIAYNPGGVGLNIWEARKDLQAGTRITDGADWKLRYDMPTATAGAKWSAVRLKQIIAIAKDVFGANYSQVLPGVDGQKTGQDLLEQTAIKQTIEYVPGVWNDVKFVGESWYFGNDDLYDTTTATESNLAANIRTNIPLIAATIKKNAKSALRQGKLPMSYEGRLHPTFRKYNAGKSDPTNPHRPYVLAWDGLFAGTVGREINKEIIIAMRKAYPGMAAVYYLMPYIWGVKNRLDDYTNPQRLGIIDGLNATL